MLPCFSGEIGTNGRKSWGDFWRCITLRFNNKKRRLNPVTVFILINLNPAGDSVVFNRKPEANLVTIVVRRLQNQQSPGLITFKHPVPSIFQRNSGGEAKIFTSIKKNLTVFDKLFIEIILLGIESYILIMSRRFLWSGKSSEIFWADRCHVKSITK